jgi:hypothetical protein
MLLAHNQLIYKLQGRRGAFAKASAINSAAAPGGERSFIPNDHPIIIHSMPGKQPMLLTSAGTALQDKQAMT